MNLPTLDFWVMHVTGGLLGGALAWGLGLALHKMLRISHASQNYWLGIWTLAVLPTVLAVSFQVLAPPSVASSLPGTLPLPAVTDLGDMPNAGEVGSSAFSGFRGSLELLFTVLYASGVGAALLRWAVGALAVWRIVRTSSPIGRMQLSGPTLIEEIRRLEGLGISLHLTQRSMSPFAVSWPRPVIILPAEALRQFNDRQLQLVIRHEAAHLAQSDPQRATLMRLIGAMFWFNPFLRAIAARVQMAAELRCDAAAIDGDPNASREFAGAYLQTLRMMLPGSGYAPVAALSQTDLVGHKLRIRHMLNGDPGRTIPLYLRALLVGLALVTGSTFAMAQIAGTKPVAGQGVVASHNPANSDVRVAEASIATARGTGDGIEVTPGTSGLTPEPAIRFLYPLTHPKITGHYGDVGGPRSRPHQGIDLGASLGTPVHAPAAGLVLAATRQYPDAPNYGTVVVLDHEDGWQSLYAHLDGFDVRPGQRVEAGQQIGRVGNTGKVTGTHLHLEILLNGQRVDPGPLLQ